MTETLEEVKTPEKAETLNTLPQLSHFADAPTLDRIEEWKTVCGSVSLSALSREEVFVWKSLQRAEWLDLQIEMSTLEGATQADLEDKVISTCLLWASEDGKASLETKAGSVPSLNEQIMQGSNFLSAAAASQLVIKL